MKERPSPYTRRKYWVTHVAALRDIDRSCPGLPVKIDRLFTEPVIYFNWVRMTDTDSPLN